jgi:hypothetical protein
MAPVSIGVIFVMLFAGLSLHRDDDPPSGHRWHRTSLPPKIVTATLGNLNIIGLTPYATSMITMLAIAAATDYVIFCWGAIRSRSIGQDANWPSTRPIEVSRHPGSA